MCELLGMSSNLPATLSLSLTMLSAHGGPPTSIRDGWGVGYHEGADVRLIKDAGPANESDWLRFIEQHDMRSHIVMAHIRKATMVNGPIAMRSHSPGSLPGGSICSPTMAGCRVSLRYPGSARPNMLRLERPIPNRPSVL
jgi:hypothetical protein